MKKWHIDPHYKTPLGLLLAYVFTYIVTYLFNVYFANELGAAVYGDFSLGMRVMQLVAPLIFLGTTSSSRGFVAGFIAKENHVGIRDYLFWNTRLFLITSIAAIALLSLTLLILILMHVYSAVDLRTYHIAILLLYVAPVLGLSQLIYSILLAFNRYIVTTYLTNMMPYVYMNVILFLGTTFSWVFDSVTIMLMVLIAYALVVVTLLVILFSKVPHISFKSLFFKTQTSNREQNKKWFKTSKRFMFNGIIFTIINTIDLLTIELVLDNKSILGYYAAILTITKMILLVRLAFNAFISVQVSKILEDKKVLQTFLNKVGGLQLIVLIVLCGALVIFSKTFLMHFGSAYLVGNLPLIILVVAIGVSVFLTPATMTLLYSGNEKRVLQINCFTLSAFVILCPVLTYLYGILGTAIASAIIEIIPRFVLALIARKQIGVKTCLVV